MAENVKQNDAKENNGFSMENIVTTALQIPGIKVNRNQLLADYFKNQNDASIEDVLTKGPIEAGCSKETLSKIADKVIFERTALSSMASFAAGIPGGLAMAATVPADMLQFFGITLRLAQELTYIYGAPDLWDDGSLDDEKVRGQLIMYCGVMFGVSSAVAGVRFISSQMSKQIVKKLPQKALTKTLWYPIVQKIGTAIGLHVTKSSVAKGLSKVVPVVGGVISGGMNFAAMMPMGKRLAVALDEAKFNYTEEKAREDFETINTVAEEVDECSECVDLENITDVNEDEIKKVDSEECTSDKVVAIEDNEKNNNKCEDDEDNKEKEQNNSNDFFGFFQKIGSDIGNGISSLFGQNKDEQAIENLTDDVSEEKKMEVESSQLDEGDGQNIEEDIFQKIEKLANLKNIGAITEEDFETKKSDLLSRI